MQLFQRPPSWSSLLAILLAITPFTSALKVIESDSLNSCAANDNENGFTPSLFQVAFTPENQTLNFNIVGFSAIAGNVTAEISVSAYGYTIFSKQLDPCANTELKGMCPMTSGEINIPSNIVLPQSTVDAVPGIAYTVPDLDGQIQIRVFDNSNGPKNGTELTCVQADLSNGKTVYQKGVGWTTAVTAGVALLTSAIVSGLGHSNTAAHIAANAMSLFGFFQAQAVFGMTAVPLPPIVASWTQNFQWSLGIIKIGFIQDIATWYQRSTGGTPAIILSRLSSTSVDVQKKKRSLDVTADYSSRAAQYMNSDLFRRGMDHVGSLVKRQSQGSQSQASSTSKTVTVHGIKRVAFKAGIESTNIFMTGYIFFIVFIVLVILGLVAFKYILEALARSGRIKGDKFQDFRNGWTTVLKGVLFRLVLIGFTQMVVLCFWELTVHDSAGEVALAIITIVTMLVMLGWVCTKVVLIARRSITLHKNPAYILYSDPVCLHKWGFLYVQFKATAYWFIIPLLSFLLVVGLFIAFGQSSGTAQAIALLILNCGFLVGVSILRPYMDKKTNAFNIAIAAVNFVSSIFLLFFTEIFGLPGLVVGVMGVIFFIMNAAFALILLLMVLVASGFAIFSKNPDVRYQPMRDDRGSFIKSQSNLTTELDALGATARGESKTPFKPRELDSDSYSSGSFDGSHSHGYNHPYSKENPSYDSSPLTQGRTGSLRSDGQRPGANASPWQRGAGYDR